MSNIKDVCRIYKMLQKQSTVIIDHIDDDTDLSYSPQEFDVFVLLREMGAPKWSYPESEEDKLPVYAETLNLQTASKMVMASAGFCICPVKTDMTQFRELIYVDSETLELGEVVYTLPKTPYEKESSLTWTNQPCEATNEALEASGLRVICESGFNAKCPDSHVSRLKRYVDTFEIIKKDRIKIGNTIVNDVFLKLGKKNFDKMKEENNIGDEVSKSFLSEYKNITEFITDKLKEKNPDRKSLDITESIFNKYAPKSPIIEDYYTYCLLSIYMKMSETEKLITDLLKKAVEKEPLYTEYLKGIPGCGPITSAYLMASLNTYRTRHPSAYVRYCGLDVRPDPKNPEKMIGTNKSTTRQSVYINKNGEVDVNNSLGYNPLLKSRILGILVPGFLKVKDSTYADIYYNTKAYYSNRPDLQEAFKGKTGKSAHKMAMRKVAYYFIVDYWLAERRLKGLPLNGGTYEEKLGLIHRYNRPNLDDQNPYAFKDDSDIIYDREARFSKKKAKK